MTYLRVDFMSQSFRAYVDGRLVESAEAERYIDKFVAVLVTITILMAEEEAGRAGLYIV